MLVTAKHLYLDNQSTGGSKPRVFCLTSGAGQPGQFCTSWSSGIIIGLLYISVALCNTIHNVYNMSHGADYFLHSNCLGPTSTYFFSPPSSYTASLPFIRPINIIGRAIIANPKSDPHGSWMWRSRKVAAVLQMSPCQWAVTEDQCVRLPPDSLSAF